MKKLHLFIWLIGLCAFQFACGGSSSSDAAEESTEAETETTEGEENEVANIGDAMEQAKKAMEQAGMKQGVEPVNFRELKKLLPASIDGMEQTNSSGETTGAMGFNISQAEGEYTGEDGKEVTISIFDTGGIAMATMGLAAWASVTIDKEDSNGYERTTTINGYKAYEKYNTRDERGEISIFVNERFIVKAEGRKVKMEDLKEALEEIDLDDLKAAG